MIPTDPDELERLTEVFREEGVADPEAWAFSQLAEGIPQLGRLRVLKAMWQGVVDENDPEWIARFIAEAERHPNAPGGGIGMALRRMLDLGVEPETITDLVRGMQYETLFHAMSVLDDSSLSSDTGTDWKLFQLDEDGEPVAPLDGLHEGLLSQDPTGREMRPR